MAKNGKKNSDKLKGKYAAPPSKVSHEEILEAYRQCNGNKSQAAARVGLSQSAYYERLHRIVDNPSKFGITDEQMQYYMPELFDNEPPAIEFPDIPSDEMPTRELIEHMKKRYRAREKREDALNWMRFKIKKPGPYGIVWMGDPHVDDDGCNWPLLDFHCKILRETANLYTVNIGDSHNNWIGRLMRKYADQEASKHQAYQLVKWLLSDAGIKWLMVLVGNHDAWVMESVKLIESHVQNICPLVDWRAKVVLENFNGRELFCDIAHNHKGQSIYNNLHGQERAALRGTAPHIVVGGHHHVWGMKQREFSENDNRVSWLLRCRGYKEFDEHAHKNQFERELYGHSVMSIVDPEAPDEASFVTCYNDIAYGADVLSFIRRQRGYDTQETNYYFNRPVWEPKS